MIPLLVETDWLDAHRSDVLVADVRWYLDGRSGLDAYRAGHLPGAVFVDLDRVLAGPIAAGSGRHPLPDPEEFARALGDLGIDDTTPLVAYDDAGGVIAARLVWMLRSIGQGAALLDGGIAAWRGPLRIDDEHRPSVTRAPRPWPADRLVTADELANTGAVVIDARDHPRHLGEVEPVDARAGHIPGARNLPCRENIDGSGRFLSAHELRRRFGEIGVDGTNEVVSYCGSGVTACHNLIALELAGLPPGRLYPGSWSQWSADPARPVTTGEETGGAGQSDRE